MRGFKSSGEIKLAVVVGGHAYDVPGFRALFDRMPGVDYFIQELDTWAASRHSGDWEGYDVHLFYDMHKYNESDYLSVRDDMENVIAEAIGQLGETQQGILVLHHALLNFCSWRENETWSRVCDVANRRLQSFHGNVDMVTHIANVNHPITRGLNDWQRVDETFVIDEPGPESDILVTTDSPQSTKALGWVHQYKNARAFCFQAGHDNRAYVDPTFQTILLRGIRWLAGKLD